MDRLQNRLVFGDNVLGRLGEAPLATKEEATAFEERQAALRSAANADSGATEGAEKATTLVDAWDAALRRLIDRLRAEAPSKIAEILASKAAIETPKATPKTTPKSKSKQRPTKKPKPTPPAKEKPKPAVRAKGKVVGKKKARGG